jgi:ribosomal protein S18 acetylase RimI-like enzyme
MKQQTKKTSSSSWRSARVSDWPSLIAMSQALYVEDPGTKPMGARDIARTLRTLHQQPVRGRAVVVVAGGVVVGYALLCSFWSNELHGEVCTIDELYIAPTHRSRGLGSKLVQGLAQRALPFFKRAVAFELEVSPRNLRARALYERLGFVARKNATLRLLRAG